MKRLLALALLLSHALVVSAAAPCDTFDAPADLVACVRENHPDVLRANARVANLDAYLKAAGQRPNPGLEAESVFNDEDDEANVEVEASVLHTFELGGKRGRRVDEAKRRQALILAESQRVRELVTLQAVLNLNRLVQVDGELKAVEESLSTFREIIGQYGKRRRLAPEQDVSLNVFSLAQGGYELKKANLVREQATLERYFTLATGKTREEIRPALPKQPVAWPAIWTEAAPAKPTGALWREAEAAKALSEAGLSLARSGAYPDLAAGPRAVIARGNGASSTGIGASLDVALPLYNRNRGAIALAQNEVGQASVNWDLRQKELTSERANLVAAYRLSVESLKNVPDLARIDRKHREAEDLFERGVVSASLVIEAHRQITDFVTEKNAQELAAHEALWTIYALDGRILEERP